jgi:hypothetical protein
VRTIERSPDGLNSRLLWRSYRLQTRSPKLGFGPDLDAVGCGLRMPRYFFDLHNDMDALDPEGKELASLDAAKLHALCEARVMVKASIDDRGHIDLRHHINVRDESGRIVYVMPFEDAVTVQRGGEVLSRPSVAG